MTAVDTETCRLVERFLRRRARRAEARVERLHARLATSIVLSVARDRKIHALRRDLRVTEIQVGVLAVVCVACALLALWGWFGPRDADAECGSVRRSAYTWTAAPSDLQNGALVAH